MKVLFCTDGSNISYHSIQNFHHWAKAYTADILCAIDWSFLPDSVAIEDSEFAIQCTNSADSILNYSDKFLSEYGIGIDKKIKICGATVDCIIETCEKNTYDFIVLGSHGKKGIQKWLGSVSQEIAAISEISTYISKTKTDRKNVLLTIDSSEKSQIVVDKFLDNFNLNEKNITLATVYESPDYLFLEGNMSSDWILDIKKKQETEAMMLLNKYENKFIEKGLDIPNKVVLSGNPAQEIIKYSDMNKIDLIVCGIRNRKNLPKFLLNSVSKRILENAKADVLIIR